MLSTVTSVLLFVQQQHGCHRALTPSRLTDNYICFHSQLCPCTNSSVPYLFRLVISPFSNSGSTHSQQISLSFIVINVIKLLNFSELYPHNNKVTSCSSVRIWPVREQLLEQEKVFDIWIQNLRCQPQSTVYNQNPVQKYKTMVPDSYKWDDMRCICCTLYLTQGPSRSQMY